MTNQTPPHRLPALGAFEAPRRPFKPVPLLPPTPRRKRPHWALRAAAVLAKALFLSFCVFVGFVTFCVTFHHLTPWR